MAVPPALDQAPGVTSSDTRDVRHPRHRPPRLARRSASVLAGVLVLVLLASLGSLIWLLAGRRGDAEDLQREREAVMAQAGQFMLRMGTYGPDLLDDQGAMPEYREPGQGASSRPSSPPPSTRRPAPPSSWSRRPAWRGRRRCFATGVSTIDSDSATALVAGTFTDTYAKGGAGGAGAVPDRGHAGEDRRRVAGRRLQPGDGSRMNAPMIANFYDLLDVAPDATEAEIRAAWRSAIADLDPADRRFRVYNQAAEVLLDPQRRRAYDAQLAASTEAERARRRAASRRRAARRRPTAAAPRRPAPGAAATSRPRPRAARRTRRAVPTWALAVLAAVTAVAVAASAWLWFAVPSDASVEESARAARSAAERAVVPILSYNALHLDEDRRPRRRYMTSDYREKSYDKMFAVIEQNAPGTKTIVRTDVIRVGDRALGGGPRPGPAVPGPAHDQQADDRADRLPRPGHGHHAAGRRRVAGRRPRQLTGAEVAGTTAHSARALDLRGSAVHHHRKRHAKCGACRYCVAPAIRVT